MMLSFGTAFQEGFEQLQGVIRVIRNLRSLEIMMCCERLHKLALLFWGKMTEVGCDGSPVHQERTGQFVLRACSDEK